MDARKIQAKVYQGYLKAARPLGLPFHLHRPCDPLEPIGSGSYVAGLLAVFTSARATGFNFDRSQGFDDILWNGIFNGAYVQPGDYFVGAPGLSEAPPRIYFVAAMPALLPISCVLCNRTITLARGNSQIDADGGQAEGLPSQEGGDGRYFGVSRDADDDDQGPGEHIIAKNVPCAMQSLAGASRGQGNVPSDAPGPGRWRIYLPQSVFPEGSVKTRDIIIDDEDNRYQVSADGWTAIGYRVEAIRLEN